MCIVSPDSCQYTPLVLRHQEIGEIPQKCFFFSRQLISPVKLSAGRMCKDLPSQQSLGLPKGGVMESTTFSSDACLGLAGYTRYSKFYSWSYCEVSPLKFCWTTWTAPSIGSMFADGENKLPRAYGNSSLLHFYLQGQSGFQTRSKMTIQVFRIVRPKYCQNFTSLKFELLDVIDITTFWLAEVGRVYLFTSTTPV